MAKLWIFALIVLAALVLYVSAADDLETAENRRGGYGGYRGGYGGHRGGYGGGYGGGGYHRGGGYGGHRGGYYG